MNVVPFTALSQPALQFSENEPFESVLSKIGELTPVKVKAKNSFIYFQGEPSESVYFLKSGRVKISTYSDDGRGIIKELLTTGDFFGEAALTGEELRRDFAIAMDDEVEFYILKIDQVKELMKLHPGLSLRITERLVRRVQRLENRLESLLFKKSRTRILEFLKVTALEQDQRVGEEYLIKPFLTHQEIARMTDTSRQTVTAVLNELKKENKIYFDRKRLLIRDINAME